METIKQIDSSEGCGIASFAMICKDIESFEQADKWIDNKNIIKRKGFMKISEMKLAVKIKFGLDPILKYSLNKTNKTALCYGRYRGDKNLRHWFVYHNGLFFDPCPSTPSPKKITKHEITRVLVIES
ncbi:hypothetical protein HCH_06381 [Hahella chejuensis KCTC 2396]|uniref:Peptidase C39 domain-containing protein n=1 Tax=Hahella chejuensis (strain KCTC 2396) TaxID=349521 RepID=Q2S8J8_HAHCH|nr:hypothetical protein [Hahella chejuensis]ABC33026.1 hypothetical protein HCH_06381 [Hahella chejuensis KCTC 2396]